MQKKTKTIKNKERKRRGWKQNEDQTWWHVDDKPLSYWLPLHRCLLRLTYDDPPSANHLYTERTFCLLQSFLLNQTWIKFLRNHKPSKPLRPSYLHNYRYFSILLLLFFYASQCFTLIRFFCIIPHIVFSIFYVSLQINPCFKKTKCWFLLLHSPLVLSSFL